MNTYTFYMESIFGNIPDYIKTFTAHNETEARSIAIMDSENSRPTKLLRINDQVPEETEIERLFKKATGKEIPITYVNLYNAELKAFADMIIDSCLEELDKVIDRVEDGHVYSVSLVGLAIEKKFGR